MLLLEALPTLPELRLVLGLVGGADALNAALACRDVEHPLRQVPQPAHIARSAFTSNLSETA